MKKKYKVYGWIHGSDYDAGKVWDAETKVTTYSLIEAEDIADCRFAKKIGRCDVLISEHA